MLVNDADYARGYYANSADGLKDAITADGGKPSAESVSG